MREPGVPTLDQMSVLVVIADTGSLAAAARRLGRAPSAISYALDNLENQLGLSLFERVTNADGRLFVELSTIRPDTVRRLSDSVRNRGATLGRCAGFRHRRSGSRG